MHKPVDKSQHTFLDFDQPMGLHMDPNNRWIRMADMIPWDEFEIKYLENGRCSLSNNLSENAIRPFTVGRNYVLNQVMCCSGSSA